MNIGTLAKASGVSAKMIRHYEELGIIPRASRSLAGYRTYGEKDVHVLRFVKRARGLGFSMKEIKALLGLWKNKARSSGEVKKLTMRHVQELEEKIFELQSMVSTLKRLAHDCHGDHRPDCPILDDFEGTF